MKKGIFFSCLLSLALCGCGGANQNANENPSQTNVETSQTVEQEKPVTTLEPVYVLSDQFGEKFLLQTAFEGNVAPATPDDLNRYKYIVYNDRYYPVQLKGAQLENEAENNNRDTYSNFDNLSGWLYEMQVGRLLEHPLNEYDAIEGAVLLVDENYKNSAKILELKNREDGSINIVTVTDDVQNKLKEKYPNKLWLRNNISTILF